MEFLRRLLDIRKIACWKQQFFNQNTKPLILTIFKCKFINYNFIILSNYLLSKNLFPPNARTINAKTNVNIVTPKIEGNTVVKKTPGDNETPGPLANKIA